MSYLKTSLLAQLVLALYFQAIIWFPLGAWNNQPGKRLLDAVRSREAGVADFGFIFAMLLPVSLFALAYWRRWFWLMWVGFVGYGTWAILEIQSWWIPYIFGADERARQNQKFLARTTKTLPSFPNHPAPDAMHFVLNMLLFCIVVLTFVGLIKQRRRTVFQSKANAPKTGK